MATSLPPASDAAQQKVHVTYTAPSLGKEVQTVTTFEVPSLLASSGTTGFRTWEAALHLGAFLYSDSGRLYVKGKKVLELGAGTGFLSILCAKHLGADHVLATDGSVEVVNDMKVNFHCNAIDFSTDPKKRIAVLQWGHALIGGPADRSDQGKIFDLIIGADVIYDSNSIPGLVATMRDLFELYPSVQILISATVRNEDTLSVFLKACGRKNPDVCPYPKIVLRGADANDFDVKKLQYPIPEVEDQIGFFVQNAIPIELCKITNASSFTDAFAI